jgi:uncharacterized protein with HEPN domain
MRSDDERLLDILDAIAAIHRHPSADRARYDADELLRFFLLKQVEIIGEAVFRLGDPTRAAHPEVPWDKVMRTRHILVHDYFDVDWSILWDILQNHIEPLGIEVERIVRERGIQS